jgi:hypothetical protein
MYSDGQILGVILDMAPELQLASTQHFLHYPIVYEYPGRLLTEFNYIQEEEGFDARAKKLKES